jgi:hypothetical protein
MPTAFIRHRARDYAKWRHVYDEFTRANPAGVAVELGAPWSFQTSGCARVA